jgi:all-trans-8'-apo-beta-carotenal 15,15'-oxygenase
MHTELVGAADPATLDGDWFDAFRDLPREHGLEPLEVEGTLPPDLAGTFYKNGIGRTHVAGVRYGHWFDGDGAVTSVRLGGGKASGAVRLVRTPGLLRQERARRPLFGGYNSPIRRPVSEIFLRDRKNPANTSVMVWQGRLFALCEAGLPFELDPATLETFGERFDGVFTTAFSAHPHDVPARRALYGFGIANGPRARLGAYELPYAGRARVIVDDILIPGPTMVHDFAATARHLVFDIAPMRMSLSAALFERKGGMDAMRWHARDGSELIVVPIDDPKASFRIQVEAHLSEHVANAFEEGGALHVDFVSYQELRGLEDYVGGIADGAVRAPLKSSIRRATIDLATKRATFETLLSAPCELPRVSPRVDATRHRFVYLAGFSSDAAAKRSFFNAVLKLDVGAGSAAKWTFPAGHYCSEALFVPKRGGTAEDDGWLLTLAYDATRDRSYLAVLDAKSPETPPVARATFNHRIPPGFHGVWVAAS